MRKNGYGRCIPLFENRSNRHLQGSLTPMIYPQDEKSQRSSRLFKHPGFIDPREAKTPQPTLTNKQGFIFNTRDSDRGNAF